MKRATALVAAGLAVVLGACSSDPDPAPGTGAPAGAPPRRLVVSAGGESPRRPAADPAQREEPPPSAPGPARGLLAQARARYAEGRLDAAQQACARGLELAPHDPQLLYARAKARAALGDHVGAAADLTAALEVRPEHAAALRRRAAARRVTGDAEGARVDLTRALALDPTAADFLARASDCLAPGDPAGAVSDYTAALLLDPTVAREAYAGRGEARAALGAFSAAAEDFGRVLDVHPYDARALRGRGLIRLEQGEVGGAAEDLERYLAAAPRDPEASEVRGRLAEVREALARERREQAAALLAEAQSALRAGDPDSAVEAAGRALELDPGSVDARRVRARARVAQDRPEEALRDVRAALESAPADPGLLGLGADLLTGRGEHAEAAALLDRLLGARPDDLDALWARARSRRAAGDLGGAQDDLRRYLEVAPEETARSRRQAARGTLARIEARLDPGSGSRDEHRDAGRAHYRAREYEAAVRELSRAIARDDDPQLYRLRGNASAGLGDHRGAIEDFGRAIALDPDYAQAYRARGYARAALRENYDGALADFTRAVELRPTYATARFDRAFILLQLGRDEEALADYERGLALAPDHTQADVARARVAELKRRLGR